MYHTPKHCCRWSTPLHGNSTTPQQQPSSSRQYSPHHTAKKLLRNNTKACVQNSLDSDWAWEESSGTSLHKRSHSMTPDTSIQWLKEEVLNFIADCCIRWACRIWTSYFWFILHMCRFKSLNLIWNQHFCFQVKWLGVPLPKTVWFSVT